MTAATELAEFLRSYGPWAVASIFITLYMMERRDRSKWQTRYESYLIRVPREMREFIDVHSESVRRLERAFIGAGIKVDSERPPAEDE